MALYPARIAAWVAFRLEVLFYPPCFFIMEVRWQQDNEVHLKLASADSAREFVASFKDDSLEHGQIGLLKDAEWSRDTVYLSINATELRGQITTAVVVGVGASQ